MRRRLTRGLLRLMGWRLEGQVPAQQRFVLVCEPHTSQWDAVLMILISSALGLRVHWMVKAELMRPPVGWVLRMLQAVPVRRDGSQGLVEQMVAQFEEHDDFVLALAPSGTRARRDGWRSGFHAIARRSDVPIVPGFLDYATRRGGVGPALRPTADPSADMEVIRATYAGVVGRNPELQTPAVLLDQ